MSQTEQLVAGLAELWQEGLLCDVKLQVEQKTIQAHRTVLSAASPYWKAMFTGNFRESSDKVVLVQDMGWNALKEIVSCIYTTRLNVTCENVIDIFSAAHICQLGFIQDRCKTFMLENIKPSMCFKYLEFAQKYDIEVLEQATESYVLRNFPEVVQEEKDMFVSISHEALCQYLSSDKLRNKYKEIVVYQAAKDWVNANQNCAERDVNEIVGHIRFALISPLELSRIMYDDFVKSHKKCQEMIEEAMRYHISTNSQPFYEGTLNKPRGESGLMLIPNGIQDADENGSYYDVVGDGEAPILTSVRREQVTPLGIPVVYESMSSVKIGNFLFVFGVDNNGYHNFTKRYDASTNVWQDMKPIPRAPAIGACAVRKGKDIFLLGGYLVHPDQPYNVWNPNDEINGSNIFKYSVEQNSWITCPIDMVGFAHASAAVLQDKICVTGGLQNCGEDEACTNNWTLMFEEDWHFESKQNMHVAKCQHISEVVEDKLYVIGGRSLHRGNIPLRLIEVYDPVANQWSMPTTSGSLQNDVNFISFGASVVKENNKLYIIGGSPYSRKVVEYNIAENKVSTRSIDLPESCQRNVLAQLIVQ